MRFLILGFLAAALAAAPSGAQQRPEPSPRRDVTVRNDSPQPIVQLFASRSANERWGGDRLRGSSIGPGQSWPLRLAGGGDCSFDFQAAYQDGRVEERRQVDICHNSVIAFDGTRARMPEQQGQGQEQGPPQGRAQGRPPQGEAHTMIVVNGTQREIISIFASPSNQTEWGDDRLGDDKLAAGQRFNFDVFGGCKQDLRVVFDNKSAEERRELDICGQNIITVHPGWTTEEGAAGTGGGGGGGGGEAPNGGGDHNRIRYLEPAH